MNRNLTDLIKRLARKPVAWAEAKQLLLSADEAEDVDALPRIAIDAFAGPMDSRADLPQWFVAVLPDGHEYLVDTEGYDYARYVGDLGTALADADRNRRNAVRQQLADAAHQLAAALDAALTAGILDTIPDTSDLSGIVTWAEQTKEGK